MTYLYKVYDHRMNLLIATRDFDLAMYVYATADKKDGWPRFLWEPDSSPAISGYPDVFLSR